MNARPLIPIILLLGGAVTATAQEPPATEAEALAALGGDTDARHRALWYAERVGWRASEEFKDFVRPDRRRPPGSSSIVPALRVLRLILEDGQVTTEMRPRVVQAARARLVSAPQSWDVVKHALALAVALGDPELLSRVRQLADDSDAMAVLLGREQIREHEEQGIPSPAQKVREEARKLLAGTALRAPRIRCPLGDCPPD